jgi:uncharacterized protein (TIGR02145 family)/gliding motility-associated-like protein
MNCPLSGNEAGLLAYWNFEEGSGTNAADLSSNGNDGTLTNGPAWSSDVPDQVCVQCTATDSVLVSINNPEITATDTLICLGDSVTLSVTACGGLTTLSHNGYDYDLVEIGGQCWFKENLQTNKYRDGTPINYPGTDSLLWVNNTTGAYAWYDNDSSTNASTYGALYNWHAVDNSAGLCPTGWHVPSDSAWTVLDSFLAHNGYNYDGSLTGNKYAKAMADTVLWNFSNVTGAVGKTDYPSYRNRSGFSGLPGGRRNSAGDITGGASYVTLFNDTDWWSSSQYSNPVGAYSRNLGYSDSNVNKHILNKGYGISVRCLRDGGNTQYQWSTGDTTTSISLTPSQTTTYTVTVTDGISSCTDSLTIMVSDPQINLGDTISACKTDSILLDAGIGYDSYYWSSSDSTQSITAMASGNYSLTVTDTAGCTGSDTVLLSIIDAGITATDTLICIGDSVILSVPENSVTYNRTGSELLPGNTTCTNDTISVTGCGGLTTLNYNGHTYDLVEIGGQCWFKENLQTNKYRDGTPINYPGTDNNAWISDSTGAYAWYDNDSSTYAPTYGALYNWHSVVNSAGLCPTGWHVPNDCEWMYLEDTLGMSIADQESGSWRGTGEGLKLKDTIHWNIITGATNSSGFSGRPGGNRYGVVGSGNFVNFGFSGWWLSSSEYDTSLVWVRSLTTSLNMDSFVARYKLNKDAGQSVRCIRDGTVAGNTQYQWSTGNTTASINVTPSQTTTYIVTVSDSISNCTDSLTITVSDPQLILDAHDISCKGDSNGYIQASTTNGIAPYTYDWSPAAGNVDSIGVLVVDTYNVTVTDSIGCTTMDSVIITEPLALALDTIVSRIICPGDTNGSITLSVTGGNGAYGFAWSNGGVDSSLSDLGSGTYSVTVTDSNNCSDSLSILIPVPPGFSFSISQDTAICAGDTASFSASGAAGYLWSTGATESSIIVSPSFSTLYYLTATDVNNCSGIDSVLLTIYDLPNADAGEDVTINSGESIQLLASGGGTYLWIPSDHLGCTDCEDPVSTPDQSITYTLIVTDSNGCQAIDVIVITVESGDNLYIPTAFSPNGDGKNDVFEVYGDNISALDVMVYDRWGDLIFQATDQATSWDGTYKGKELNGVFIFHIKVTTLSGNEIIKKGDLTIVR